jgi:hypothetical protein
MAWVITHAHDDHYGAFVKFASVYGALSKIKVESFIFNFCDTTEETKYMSEGTSSCSKVRSTIKSKYPKARIYKCLTGQVSHYAGAESVYLMPRKPLITGVSHSA